MNISIYPSDSIQENCLVLVGGSGDTTEGFTPLVTKISGELPDRSICTFSFTSKSESDSLLDIQSRELEEVLNQLISEYHFSKIYIFCTSQGAYSTVKALTSHKFDDYIVRVIMYDPADYYTGMINLHSWSGSQDYSPISKVVSSELANISGKFKINVVHLTLRNYGADGYIEKDFADRGIDNPSGFPRLNTQMVKSFYQKVPVANRGKYIEESNIPHAFLRDGNVSRNILSVVNTIVDNLIVT